MSESSDNSLRSLLQRIRSGDRQARRQLFALLGDDRRFGASLRAMARRILPRRHRARRLVESQDLVQSALRSGYGRFSDFRGESEGELYLWLRAILRTKMSRILRRERSATRRGGRAMADRPSSAEEVPLSAILDQELRQLLRSAIGSLPDGQRLVIELRLKGTETAEIGRLLGIEPDTVRKRESRAVAKLKVLLVE